ncbi:class I lanthipeptide [Acidobacteriota bacterium]
MKPKKIKKLSLNKKTVANLEEKNMKDILAGRVIIFIDSDFCTLTAPDTCCCHMSIGPWTVCCF